MAKAKDKGQEPAKTIEELAESIGQHEPGTLMHSLASAASDLAAVGVATEGQGDDEATQGPVGEGNPRPANDKPVKIGDKVAFSDGLCEGWLALVTCTYTPDLVDLAVFPPGATPTHARNVPFGPDAASFRRWFWLD